MNLDTTNSGWRTSWDLFVAGNFLGDGSHASAAYDRSAGSANLFGFDAAGNMNLDNTFSGAPWDIVTGGYIAGNFVGNGRMQVLIFDRDAGSADILGFETTGGIPNLHTSFSGWPSSGTVVVAGNFIGNGCAQVLIYDPSAGTADVFGFDATGNMNLHTTISGWRTSWYAIVPGHFIGNGRSQLLLYDRSAGNADVVGFDDTGNVNLDTTNSGWRTTWTGPTYV